VAPKVVELFIASINDTVEVASVAFKVAPHVGYEEIENVVLRSFPPA
jgi:hypothetical protein